MEASLVVGITTICLRGRYMTMLPWALGQYFSADADAQGSRRRAAGVRDKSLSNCMSGLRAYADVAGAALWAKVNTGGCGPGTLSQGFRASGCNFTSQRISCGQAVPCGGG